MFYRLLLVFALLLGLSACALPRNGPPPLGTEAEITELARAIEDLSPQVNPEEAARAARIAYRHTHELAIAYQITDPPLIHNVKVNNGSKPFVGQVTHDGRNYHQGCFGTPEEAALAVARVITRPDGTRVPQYPSRNPSRKPGSLGATQF